MSAPARPRHFLLVPRSLAVLLAALLLAAAARAAGAIEWMKGFPQRLGDQVILMWMPAPGAVRYAVSRKDAATGATVSMDSAATYYMDATGDPATSYVYQIVAFDAEGRPVASSAPATLAVERSLERPRWIGKSYQQENRIFLTWEGDSRTIYYNIYKTSPDKAKSLLGSVKNRSFVDDKAKAGQLLLYTVRAVDAKGKESAESDVLEVTVEPWARAETGEEPQIRHVDVLWSLLGGSPEGMSEPTAVAFADSRMYVTDIGRRAVLVFSVDGKHLGRTAVQPPDYAGEWGIPWGIDIHEGSGRFAVTFLKSPNVRIFDMRGQIVHDVVVQKPEQLKDHPLAPQPMYVVFDADGGFWITEYTYGQVIRYSKQGYEVGRFGTPKHLETFPAEPFRTPTFLCRDPKTGDFLVVDSFQAKIFRLSPDGVVVGDWERFEKPVGMLRLPKGIKPNGEGEFLIVDGMLATLQAVDAEGKLIAVYRTRDEEKLLLPSMVSVSRHPGTGDLFAVSKVERSIFRLRVLKDQPKP